MRIYIDFSVHFFGTINLLNARTKIFLVYSSLCSIIVSDHNLSHCKMLIFYFKLIDQSNYLQILYIIQGVAPEIQV